MRYDNGSDKLIVSALEKHIQKLAQFDPDTGLLTYDALIQTIDQAILLDPAPGMALIELRIKGLARIHDAHGRGAISFIIHQIAERLTRADIKNAVIGRIDYKSFGVFLTRTDDPAHVIQTAKTLHSLCEQSFEWKALFLEVEIGAGISLVEEGCRDAASLIHHASLATRISLEPESPGYSFFNPEDARLARRKSALVSIITEAVNKQLFTLTYQPFFEFSTGKLAGFEALLRLNQPQVGFISPEEFIPIAEEYGLINRLGAWVVDEACRTASTWPAELVVAVNFSPAQFYSGTLLGVVNRALENHSFPAYRLEIEITEGTLLRDQELVLAQLSVLRDMGCAIALDDFGTGYSSLSYLWKFPFSKFKIDRSFISALENTPKAPGILKSIMFLSKNLGHVVTAEGIETIEQMVALKELGCDYLQGYLCGKPVEKIELAAIILKNFAEQIQAITTAAPISEIESEVEQVIR